MVRNERSAKRQVLSAYPNDPQKLTGCQYDTLQLQIDLTHKQAGLVWTIFTEPTPPLSNFFWTNFNFFF